MDIRKGLTTILAVLLVLTASGQNLPIIDMHLHAHDAEDRIIKTLSRYVNEDLGLEKVNSNEELEKKTFELIKKHNLICLTTGDKMVQEWKEKLPNRIYPSLLFTHPNHFDLKVIEEDFETGKWFALGEIVTQYFNVAPNDTILNPIWDMAERLDIPVGIHIGLGPPGGNENEETDFRASLGNPLLLEEVLIAHPDLRIFIMHAGWPMLDATINMLYQYPQLYVDIALINWAIPQEEFHYYLKRLIDAGFGKRIMFGTDQMVWPNSIELAIESIESADYLSEEQKRDIFYNNAATFLNLTDNEIEMHHQNR